MPIPPIHQDTYHQITTWEELALLYLAVGIGMSLGILIGMAIERWISQA